METAPWQRHLLSLADDHQELNLLTPETVAVAVAVAVVLVLVVLLCTCDDGRGYDLSKGSRKQKDNTELRQVVSRKSTVSTKASSNVEDPAAVHVEVPANGEVTQPPGSPGELTPNSNGIAGRNSAGTMSHTRQASSGSGQMRPTSLRELPDLPNSNHKRNPSGAGVIDKPSGGWSGQQGGAGDGGDSNSYDHLGAKINSSTKGATNYDHINIESQREVGAGTTPASESDAASDGHYAQVREQTYDVVQDVKARASAKVTSQEFDPYSKVKDDDDKEDPYAKVKDTDKDDGDDDYAHLKHDQSAAPVVASNLSGGARLDEEDPYERVFGDSASGNVQASVVDPDDPYSVVMDQSSVTVVPLRSSGATSHGAGEGAGRTSQGDHSHLQFADDDTEGQDDYAVVVKDRHGSASREEESGGGSGQAADEDEIEPYFSTPPEPPRMYGASEVRGLQGAVGGAGISDSTASNSQTQKAKEHCYTKVTARESLASMTARNALNTYEIVPDLPENTYATVEGGSGDGVVRYPSQSSSALQHSTSQLSETYAEIGASASGNYTSPAPEPPSLDSLHSMTKSTTSNDGDHGNRGLGSPSGGAAAVTIADDGYAVVSKTSNFSPSETALPQIPTTSGSVHSISDLGEDVTINGVTLHPDYHRVKDCITDQDSENDPNYESVDEALSKSPVTSSTVPSPKVGSEGSSPKVTVVKVTSSPTRRTHEYEEVSPPTSPVVSSSAHQQAARSSNGSVPSGSIPTENTPQGSNNAANAGSAEAAEVRERVLQGHMYEDISEVKNSPGGRSSQNVKQKSADGAG